MPSQKERPLDSTSQDTSRCRCEAAAAGEEMGKIKVTNICDRCHRKEILTPIVTAYIVS